MHRFIWILMVTALATVTHAQSPAAAYEPPATDQAETLIVTHKRQEFGDPNRKTFEQLVLQLALEKTRQKTGEFEMVPIDVISRTHAIAALEQNIYDNFVMLLSFEDALLKSGNLIFIPFPIELGALSYRICYANKKLVPQVQQINNLQQLKAFKLGVGAGWVDAKILQHHGLQIVEGSNITSLFRMTQAGRVDIFCPSPTEYFHDLRAEKSADLQLDNKLALYYPLPKFIFTNKHNKALLERIQEGIEIAYKDGSYLELWRSFHEADMRRAKLSERHFIRMENPFITTLPNDYKQYLFSPLNKTIGAYSPTN
ncbi:MAG TPA: transporter substrate-binding domain-containing protein [Cellvibrio sp.]|nr:transporter substrate-binding domain-containing protein [Cellvibrio sp.]